SACCCGRFRNWPPSSNRWSTSSTPGRASAANIMRSSGNRGAAPSAIRPSSESESGDAGPAVRGSGSDSGISPLFLDLLQNFFAQAFVAVDRREDAVVALGRQAVGVEGAFYLAIGLALELFFARRILFLCERSSVLGLNALVIHVGFDEGRQLAIADRARGRRLFRSRRIDRRRE